MPKLRHTANGNNGCNAGCPERFVLFGQLFYAQNIKTAFYQKRILCNRDGAKPYPCCQNIKTALYQKRGLDFRGYDNQRKECISKAIAL